MAKFARSHLLVVQYLALQWIKLLLEKNVKTMASTDYTSARRWYAPHDLTKINNSEIERVTEMDLKKMASDILVLA